MMNWKHLSLKTKLILSFSLATVLGFAFMGIGSYIFTEKLLRNLTLEKLEAEIQGIRTTIQLTLEDGNQDQDAKIEKIRQHLKPIKIYKTGYYFIIDSNAKLLLHPAKEGEVMKEVTDLDGRFIFKEILKQKNGTIEYQWLNAETKKPQSKMATFRYIPEVDWYVAASFNKEESEDVLGTLKWTIATVSGVSILVMILLSMVYGHRISQQLQLLSDQLFQITRQTTRESDELAASSESLSSAATESAASLEETVASLEEINSQVHNNLKMTEETNLLGKKSLETAKNSEIKLKTLKDFMVKVKDDSKKIDEISTLIDDIAFQTNLLSLNASVEAARAGEHGKGFAVVADAVRSLATKSAESAKQITQMIAQISDRIEMVAHAGNDVDKSFAEIVTNIQKLSTLVDEISKSSEEQADGISQISKAMNQLDQVTQSNSQLAETISLASNDLSEHGQNLEKTVALMNQMIKGDEPELTESPVTPLRKGTHKQLLRAA